MRHLLLKKKKVNKVKNEKVEEFRNILMYSPSKTYKWDIIICINCPYTHENPTEGCSTFPCSSDLAEKINWFNHGLREKEANRYSEMIELFEKSISLRGSVNDFKKKLLELFPVYKNMHMYLRYNFSNSMIKLYHQGILSE